MKSGYSHYIAALLTSTAVLLIFLYIDRLETEKLHQAKRIEVLQKMETVKSALEGSLNTNTALTYSMVAHISTHHDISHSYFDLMARALMIYDPFIKNIGVAKDNIISHMYPLKGNEKALGLDYMKNEKQKASVLRAIESKKTVVAGPVNLVQGGVGLITRTPIYLTPAGGEIGSGQYWGVASVVINMVPLFEAAGILNNKDLIIALRGKDSTGSEGEIFFGKKAIFDSDPVLLNIDFPVGSWQMAAVPIEGWHVMPHGHGWFLGGGIAICLLSGLLVGMLVRHPVLLRREVERVTGALLAAEAREEEIKEHIEREERGRLEKDLHDGIGQSLLALKLKLQLLKAGNLAADEKNFSGLINEISGTTRELKGIISNLSILPHDADLATVFRQLGARIEESSGISIDVSADGDFEALPWKMKENLYRIYQEALNNIVKHSGADKAAVKLVLENGTLRMIIADNGRGFDSVLKEDMKRGIGLTSMRERANVIGGALDIDGRQGRGTTINLEVPLK